MTGAEHYREAERLLVSCQIGPPSGPDHPATYPACEDGVDSTCHALAAAQAHATLALAAATSGANGRSYGSPPPSRRGGPPQPPRGLSPTRAVP